MLLQRAEQGNMSSGLRVLRCVVLGLLLNWLIKQRQQRPARDLDASRSRTAALHGVPIGLMAYSYPRNGNKKPNATFAVRISTSVHTSDMYIIASYRPTLPFFGYRNASNMSVTFSLTIISAIGAHSGVFRWCANLWPTACHRVSPANARMMPPVGAS